MTGPNDSVATTGAPLTPTGDSPPRLAAIRRYPGLLIDSRPVLMATLIIIVVAYMSVRYGERFLNEANISSVLLNAAQTGILTVGMTILMIGGAIDLSVGAVLGLAGVVAALLVKQYLIPVPVAFLVGLAVGAGCGAINGIITTRLHINALITTLATLGI